MTKPATKFVARFQTARGITHRVITADKAAEIMASALGTPGPGGALAVWQSTPEYRAAGECVFRAKAGYLPLCWEWNGVGI
jgi:hypothetical protein